MTVIKRFPLLVLCGMVGLSVIALRLPAAEEEQAAPKAFIDGTGPGWVPLTGDDFERVNCDPETFVWKEGHLACKGTPVGVTKSKKKYTNFELVAEWKHLKSGGNSGIFLWASDEALTDLKRDALTPGGIEVKVIDDGYDE